MRTPLLFSSLLAASLASAAGPALTVYNQNFALVREALPLALTPGVNQVTFTGATALLEPDSVILRDPSGKRVIRILEQSYRADPVSMEVLLRMNEGKTIDFMVPQPSGGAQIVPGRIVRSGSSPMIVPVQQPFYGMQPSSPSEPIIEFGGKLRFGLPGTPLFPALGPDMVLNPTLTWALQTDNPGKFDAELCYMSRGLTWDADYNVVGLNPRGDLEIVGWVTMENRSGKTFEDAAVKLMAGDVNKLRPREDAVRGAMGGAVAGFISSPMPQVTEKTFDEYHLYTLPRPVTLHDRETKQVEFIRASGVNSKIVYIYDGAKIDERYRGWNTEMIRQNPDYGSQMNPKVWVMREFMNTGANHLGMPLPRGRVRFYSRDTDGRMEFTGEDSIEHTPREERVRVFTGAAFDLTGERRRVDFRVEFNRYIDESFEIKVRNRKSEPAQIRVVEHLYRGLNWNITSNSMPWTKTDSQTIEFEAPLQPGEEKTLTYAVHYTW